MSNQKSLTSFLEEFVARLKDPVDFQETVTKAVSGMTTKSSLMTS